jgi:hypothetical protein
MVIANDRSSVVDSSERCDRGICIAQRNSSINRQNIADFDAAAGDFRRCATSEGREGAALQTLRLTLGATILALRADQLQLGDFRQAVPAERRFA